MAYIVQTAAANMPSSCWGTYRRVAVLEVNDGLTRVAMISERARGVKRIVVLYDRLNVGKTDRCAYARALRNAYALTDRLNGGETCS
jgi:hypothetical protein